MNEFGNQSKSYLSELVRLNKYNLIACGYEQLTVAGTAVGLSSIPPDAKYALVEVESSITTPAIRYLELGNTILPTSSTGIRRSDTEAFDITGRPNLINFRAIQISAGTHKLNIQYYK
jgi:hypothetical protein